MIKRLLRLVGRWARKPVNHTSWVAVVTPTDRPKSVRNRCLIELFCGVVCVVTLPFWHFCWCRGFCHRTESDLFLFLLHCYEKDFMSDLQKSKRFDLIDMFNDTSRYLDDIFTIDNPEFEKHISGIYPAELQLNKANTSDKETSFLDLNIKVIGSDIHTSVYDKRDDFGFPIVNFPWLSGDVPRLPSYGIYISQLVRFARCCTSVGYRYHKLRKTFRKFFRSYSELLSKFGDISFQEYL